MNAQWIVVLFCLVILVACATPSAPVAAPTIAAPTVSGELNITLKRSGGIAGRNETFSLKPDGTVTTGTQTKQADGGAAAAAKLAGAIAATGIYNVAPGKYMSADTCCDRYIYELTLVAGGQTFSFTTIDGYNQTPSALLQTLGLIQQYIVAAR